MPEFKSLWPGGPRFASGGTFPIGTDSILLADFAESPSGRVCDLGCGTGALLVLLCAKFPALRADGVELLPEDAGLCRQNLAENGWADRTRVIAGDLCDCRQFFPAGAYDLVVCNPPYFPAEGGKRPTDEGRATARSETACTLRDVCAVAAYLTKNGGSFALVHKPQRLPELFAAMTQAGLEPKRLRLVQHTVDSPPSIALIEGRRGGKPGLAAEPALILRSPDGTDTSEVRRIYHLEET